MTKVCDIIPRIKNRQGELVDSILFTNLLASGLKREEAINAYSRVFTAAFKREFGDWEYLPATFKGKLDANGQPTIESLMHSSFFSSNFSVAKQRDHSLPEDTLENSAKKTEVLVDAFAKAGIEVSIKYNNALEENANVIATGEKSARITLNPNKVFQDTIPHEFGHIYVDLLGDIDIVKQGIEQLYQTPLYQELKKLYPELSHDMFEKELLVTAIGREAADIFANPDQIRRWNFWLTRFFRKMGELLGIHENVARTLAMDMINMKLRKGTGTLSTTKQKQKASIFDVEGNSIDKGMYLDSEAGVYKDKFGNVYHRLTEWIDTSFSKLYQDMKMKPYERNADKAFKNNNLNKDTDKIKAKDENGIIKEYSYSELVEHERMMQNTKGRIYGNIVHAMIQYKINPSQSIQDNIRQWMDGIPGESYPQNPKDFDWIDARIGSIFRESEINTLEAHINPEDKDILKAELVVGSKLLGIATTIDNLVQHKNGLLSIIDWKTGGLFKDKIVTTFMRYGRNQANVIKDTKLNRAKLEVVLRALMVKETSGDKTVRFRNLKIVHMNKRGNIITSNIDVKPFLGMIESYYKDPANNQTHIYEELKRRGLLEANSYMGNNFDLESDVADMLPADAVKTLNRRLNQVNNLLNETTDKVERAELEKRKVKLTSEILKYHGQPIGEDTNSDNVEDMGFFKRWATNMYGVKHPKVKAFFAHLTTKKQKARNRIQELYTQHDKLLETVAKEYFEKHQMKEMVKKLTLGQVNLLKYTELYDFMWEKKEGRHGDGLYARIITEDMVGTGEGQYTRAQYEYNKWYRETLAKEYKKVSSKIALYRGGHPKTVAEMMGIENELDDDFMPRYMLNMEEVGERYGYLSKKALDYQVESVLSDFTEEEYNLNDIKYGIPIKYRGNDSIIQSGNHTLSAEVAFKNFIANVVMKDELDDVYSVGQGLITLLEDAKDVKGDDFSNTIDFLKDQIYLHVLDVKKSTKWSSRGFVVPWKDGKHLTISIDKIMRLLKSWVSASSMWIKPVAGGANAALIFTLNLKDALKGSLAKRFGIDEGQIDFTFSDLMKAHVQYGEFLKDLMLGRKEQNKLWQMARKLDYLPDNYDYAIRKNELMGVKNKLFDKSNLYLFHSIGEEYGNLLLMAAQLNHYKMGSKTAWESYDNQGNFIVDTNSRKLKLEDGSELTELSALEVMKLKRVSSRIHGAYRQDERVALELTALGQWALQFKKYLPNILENMVQGKYEDMSIGYYKLKKNDNNEDVYYWVSRINEGRVRVMGKFILAMMGLNNDYKWSELQPEQKLQIQELMMTGTMYGMMLTAHTLIFGDDDDEKDAVSKAISARSKRLIEDTTQGFAVWDLLNSFQNQTTVLPKLYKTSVAVKDMLIDGVVLGKTTQRGDMIGANAVQNATPFFTTVKELERFGLIEDTKGLK